MQHSLWSIKVDGVSPFHLIRFIYTDFNVLRSDVAKFFQPSIDCIVKAILEQRTVAHKTISVSLYRSFLKNKYGF